MKPIFQEEKTFLETLLDIQLPSNCWRDGSSIYVNPDTKYPLVKFKVEGLNAYVIKNNFVSKTGNCVTMQDNKGKSFNVKNRTLREEYELRKDHIAQLLNESISRTKECIIKHQAPVRISLSGGKDSDVLYHILITYVFPQLNMTSKDYKVDVFNTTNDTADTYKHILHDLKISREDIHTPTQGWGKWLREEKNYFLPSVMVRNCCSTYKEGQVKKILDKEQEYVILLGMRKSESSKRAKYAFDLNEAIKQTSKKLNCPEHWHRFLPIVNWEDIDVWLYLYHNDIKINRMYSLGFNRCGCLICPYSSDYTDLLIRKYYPLLWDNWAKMVSKNYDLYGVEKRLKWTREEWVNGKWKQGMSKEYALIQRKPTKERVQELANIKGISTDLAVRYFKKECECGKSLNPDEVAMFLKLNGRYDGKEDTRVYLCKRCLCTKLGLSSKEYQDMVFNFRQQGCNLF